MAPPTLHQVLLSSDRTKGGLDMTVSLCHRHTPAVTLAALTASAELVVAAAGGPGLGTAAMVRPGAVLVDVGLTRVQDHLGRTTVVGDLAREVRQVGRAGGWLVSKGVGRRAST